MDTWTFPLDTAAIEDITARTLGPITGLLPLSGDASTRRFFRVLRPEGASLVAMVLEGAFDPATHPQILVGSYFESLGLPTPRLEASSPEAGLLYYEDLGDLLLQDLASDVLDRTGSASRRIEKRVADDADRGDRAEGERIARLYREAVGMLAVLQDRGTRELPADHPSACAALDEDRLGFELRFFREHYIEGFRDLALGPRESAALDRFFLALAHEAAALPRVLCHRDYHSRNLLVQGDRLRLVDFQDARLGPAAYDLASLLRDSYIGLPKDLEAALFEAFLAENAAHIPSADEFREGFEVVALQRNLKAIGTFGYQASVRGKTHYLPYIAPTWQYALGALERVPRIGADARPVLEMLAGV